MSTDPTQISAQPPPEKPVSKRMSRGEKMFDWLTYGSIAGVITYIASIPLGYGLRYSNAGKSLLEWSHGAGARFGVRKEVAEDVMMATALMQGGNLTLVPVKMMEDNKPELVHRFNCMLKDDAANEDVQKPDTITQTWASLVKSRLFLAWTPVFLSLRGTAMLVGQEKFENFEKAFSKNVLCNPLGMPTHVNGAETKLFRIGRIGAIDLFATAAAASLLYVGSRIFGERKRNGNHKEEAATQPTAEVLPTAITTHHGNAKHSDFTGGLKQKTQFVDYAKSGDTQPQLGV